MSSIGPDYSQIDCSQGLPHSHPESDVAVREFYACSDRGDRNGMLSAIEKIKSALEHLKVKETDITKLLGPLRSFINS